MQCLFLVVVADKLCDRRHHIRTATPFPLAGCWHVHHTFDDNSIHTLSDLFRVVKNMDKEVEKEVGKGKAGSKEVEEKQVYLGERLFTFPSEQLGRLQDHTEKHK